MGLWKLLQPDWHDDLFAQYLKNDNLLDVTEALIGHDIKVFLTMFIYKPPGLEGVDHPFHQDGVYFPFGPLDRVLGSWVALDRTTEANGTLVVIPGSHRSVLDHEWDKDETQNYGILEAKGYAAGHPDEVAVEVEPGAGVFFHSRLLYRTGSNRTAGHRRVITVHCASATCWLQGELKGHLKMQLVRGQEYTDCI